MVIIGMLALGIGATIGIYSLFHQVLLRPLPVHTPHELVTLREDGRKTGITMCGDGGNCNLQTAFSYPVFHELEARQTAFSGLAAYYGGIDASIVYRNAAVSGRALLVSGSYFDVLGLQPALGRLIGPQDQPRIGESRVVVLSYDFWRSRFGGADDVLGQTLTLNEQQLTIVGVTPPSFSGTSIGSRPNLFVPLTLRWLIQPEALEFHGDSENRFANFATVFARLRPGTSVESASTAMSAIYAQILEEEIPLNPELSADEIRQRRLVLEPGARGQSDFPETAVRPLALLLGTALLLLLIVCANVANLLIARGAARAGDLNIRATLGATRGRLVQQLLLELLLLATIGIVISIPVAWTTLQLIATTLPAVLAGVLGIHLNLDALAVGATASLITVLLFGLLPALQATRTESRIANRSQAGQLTPAATRSQNLLMAGQIALSMVLLVLAGLFVRSLINIAQVDIGMDVDSVVHFQVNPGLSGYGPGEKAALHDRLTSELLAQPGVTGVASARDALIGFGGFWEAISVAGFEDSPVDERLARSNPVSPGLFDLLSMPLIAGRPFTQSDRALPVAIVNQSFADRFDFGTGPDALGKSFAINQQPDVQIIGMVADAKYGSLKKSVPPQVFLPYRPDVETFVPWLQFYVRGAMEPDALMRMIPRVIAAIAPRLPISDLATLHRELDEDIYVDRMIGRLSMAFAGLATFLAAIGLYSLLAYGVTQRTRELGLRLALGAEPRRLRRMVFKQVTAMGLIGGGIGLLAAAGIGRVVESMLFGLSGDEPLVLIAAISVLYMTIFAAAYLPARRASRIAPMEALRYE